MNTLKFWQRILSLSVLMLCLTSFGAWAAVSQVAAESDAVAPVGGVVVDAAGIPVVGAFVLEKGTTNGTITDIDGKFSIDVPSDAVLEISSMGYVTQEIAVGGNSFLNVTLLEDTELLEEVVVVGYGTQKKANLTGAVSSIDFADKMQGRPVLSASSALAGMAPGMNVMQTSGKPGSESATIRIRGIGSFTDSSSGPLVLVDGIEWSMDNVNPNDIESISVLKDAASTAIYGTRAANGVILITTKNGVEQKPRINYSYKGIVQMPYNELEWVSDYLKYMLLFNEGCYNAGKPDQFTTVDLDAWYYAQQDPYGLNEYGVPNYVAYPNTNWFKEIFQTGYSQEHNISISGGSKAVRYLISGGYLDNQGVMNRFNLDSSSQKANFRTSIEADVTKWFTIGSKIFGQWQQYGTANIDNGFNYLYMTTPGIYPGSENAWGKPASGSESPNANNIFAHMAGSVGTKRTWRVNGTVYAKIRPYKGVSIEGTFNYAPTFSENKTRSRENGYWDYVTDTRSSSSSLEKATVSHSMSRDYRMSTELLARYNETFGDHAVGALVGYSALSYRKWGWGYSKKGATDWVLKDPSTYAEMNNLSSTAETGWGLRSYFGRVNYAYKDKYLFEANLRVDGSSKFGPENRYGVFPSFSAGWKIHEEPFMSSTRSWLDNLKLRASWGQTGNCSGIGNFAWQATYDSENIVIDGVPSTGLYVASMSNLNLKWETTSTTDIGLDMAFFNNRLTADVDYYFKQTKDILFTPSTYLTMGNVSQVPSNLGRMWNQGVEIALGWKDTIGKDFYYNVGINFSYNKNRVTSFKGQLQKYYNENGKFVNNLTDVAENKGSGKLCEGHEIGEHYLLSLYRGTGEGYSGSGWPDVNAGPVDGMIRTEKDFEWVQIMMDAGYSFNGVTKLDPNSLWYGDFIYADSNGDQNYGNEDDKNFNGHSATPSYNLGINLGFSWKGLDFSMQWAGAFDYYIYWSTEYYNTSLVSLGYGISERIANDHYFYDPGNPYDSRTNIYGTYPRLYNGASRNKEASDFYEYKADFLKLKSVQLGYSLPSKWMKKIAVQDLRFYVSGENLLTITKFPGMDPELGGTIGYPLMRQVSVGAQITF